MIKDIQIIDIKEVCNNKFIKQTVANSDVKGLSLRVVGYDQDRRKVSFYTPTVSVATKLDGSYRESLLNNTGGFFAVEDDKVIPTISKGEIIKVRYNREEMFGKLLVLKVVRLDSYEHALELSKYV